MIAEIEKQETLIQLPKEFFDSLNDDFGELEARLSDGLSAAYLLGLDHVREAASRTHSAEFASPNLNKPDPDDPNLAARIDPIELRFDVQPEEAIDYFKRKRVVLRKQFDDLRGEARSAAFTVSGIYKRNVLQGFRDEITQALEQGTPQREIIKRFKNILSGAGHKELGAWHLEVVARTNMGMAYGVGRRRGLEDVAGDLPFWEYHAVMDDRTRPTHAALNGLVLPANHPFWDDHFPPWDFSCRCSVTASSEIPAGYDHSNPSGQAQIAYDEGGNPLKAESGTTVYDLATGKFKGVPPQAGLKEVIETGTRRAKESKGPRPRVTRREQSKTSRSPEQTERPRVTLPKSLLSKAREIRHERDEHLSFFDVEGAPVADFVGDAIEVRYELTSEQINRIAGGYDIHNHFLPEYESFSTDDVMDAAKLEMGMTCIVTPRYFYTMRPPPGGWKEIQAAREQSGQQVAERERPYQEIERLFDEFRGKVVDSLLADVRAGAISVAQAKIAERHRIWELVARKLKLRYRRRKL